MFELFDFVVEADDGDLNGFERFVQIFQLRVLFAYLLSVPDALVNVLCAALSKKVKIGLKVLELVIDLGQVAESQMEVLDHSIDPIREAKRVIFHLPCNCNHFGILSLGSFLKLGNACFDLHDHLVSCLSV